MISANPRGPFIRLTLSVLCSPNMATNADLWEHLSEAVISRTRAFIWSTIYPTNHERLVSRCNCMETEKIIFGCRSHHDWKVDCIGVGWDTKEKLFGSLKKSEFLLQVLLSSEPECHLVSDLFQTGQESEQWVFISIVWDFSCTFPVE